MTVAVYYQATKKASGFELTFQNCIVKNSYKISLVLVSPESPPWLGLRVRKCRNFAHYRLLENAFQCKLRYLVRATQQSDFRMKKSFSNNKNLIETIKITWAKP